MPHIQQLDPHVADLIAAGEVVERPASVVKELMENAIDAGATSVTVEIQNGGMRLIRVTDDGCGIAADEVETAFLRHATSKIRSEYDLEAIGTLGFRGEALAAIAAVSRVEILTRPAGTPFGVSLMLEGGQVVQKEEAGCPAGTTMLVRDLFFNTPARLKFVKKDVAEGAAVFGVVQRTALSHPEVGFKFLKDGKQELQTPGDGQLQSALYSVLGRDMALGYTPVRGSGEEVSVSGFVTMPTCCRGTRSYQYFFINGRYVKSRTMAAALEEAYQNQKMVGKFPGCVLHVTTKLNAVDVNVHPTKTEVKFQSEKKLFDGVYYAVRSALEGEVRRPVLEVKLPSPLSLDPPPMEQLELGAGAAKPASALPLRDSVRPAAPPVRSVPPLLRRAEEVRTERRPAAPPLQRPSQRPAGPTAVPPERRPAPEPVLAAPQEELPWRVAGEVLNTYIIVEQGDKILLIDKHAAHERMNFDRMKAEGYTPMVQQLLVPLTFTPTPEEGAVLLQNLPLLRRFGFEAEDFGGGALLVRQAPFDVDPGEIEATLSELAGRLLTAGAADPAAQRDALLHTMACKAAMKGGQRNGPEELKVVAQAVVSGAVKYCPHGRPVAIELTRAQLEKQFKRA
jgi:DNA mismatch repair protein MutL